MCDVGRLLWKRLVWELLFKWFFFQSIEKPVFVNVLHIKMRIVNLYVTFFNTRLWFTEAWKSRLGLLYKTIKAGWELCAFENLNQILKISKNSFGQFESYESGDTINWRIVDYEFEKAFPLISPTIAGPHSPRCITLTSQPHLLHCLLPFAIASSSPKSKKHWPVCIELSRMSQELVHSRKLLKITSNDELQHWA